MRPILRYFATREMPFWVACLALPFVPLLQAYKRHCDRRVIRLITKAVRLGTVLSLRLEGRQYIPR